MKFKRGKGLSLNRYIQILVASNISFFVERDKSKISLINIETTKGTNVVTFVGAKCIGINQYPELTYKEALESTVWAICKTREINLEVFPGIPVNL